MKKIIVTGSTSMIGTALIEAAISKGTEVYAIVRPDSGRKGRLNKSPLVHTVFSSLDSLDKIDGSPSDCDVFYHLAWAGTDKSTRDNPLIHEQNIRYSLNAVELAARLGCHRFVGAGSQAEYGPVDGLIDEHTLYCPVTSYGVAKFSAGILTKKLCEQKGIEHIWGRIFSIYGPHDNDGTMLEYAISCFLRGETAHFSASTQWWNYLYESDAGEMFYALGRESTPSGTWLIANNQSRRLKDYINVLIDTFGPDAKADFAPRSSEIPPGLLVNVDHTTEVLHYHPMVSFEEGIARMIQSKKCMCEYNYDV